MDDCLDMLAECHQSIEAQLATLEELCRSPARAPNEARTVIRYFDGEGLQHQRDEDEDLFPLLRALAAERGRADIAAVMDELEREHASMDRQWSRMREKLTAVADGRGGAVDADEVMRFAWLYRRHMQYEAAAILPFAQEALSAEQRGRLAARMAARRGMVA